MTPAPNTPIIPDDESFLIYRDDERHVNHLPGPNPGTPYTKCGLDAGAMAKRDHPVYAAAVWCTDCFREAAGL